MVTRYAEALTVGNAGNDGVGLFWEVFDGEPYRENVIDFNVSLFGLAFMVATINTGEMISL